MLRQDQSRSSVAARLAPKKYGDHISQPHDEFARQLAYDEDGDVLLDGNGDIVRAR